MDVEILARTDDDDELQTIRAVALLGQANVIMGPRGEGYWGMNLFYNEMAAIAKAPWIWLLNDEVTISGSWVEDLAEIPVTGCVVQPESYQIGHSMYRKVHDTTCPIVPNHFWKLVGEPGVPKCTDIGTYQILNKQLGWKTVYLPKLHMAHHRFTDQEYETHHKV